MSHALPPQGHPAREMFEVQDLVDIALGKVDVIDAIWKARRAAERTFAASPAARRVCFIVLRMDNDELELISFGRRGGWKREWRFGPWKPQRTTA